MKKQQKEKVKSSRARQNNMCLKRIEEYFQSNELRYGKERMSDGDIMLMGVMGGYKGVFSTFNFFVVVGDDDVRGYVLLPFSIPEDRYLTVADFISRINSYVRFGKFIMDYDDGEIRFQVVFPQEALLYAPTKISEQLLYLPLEMISEWVDAFDEVARRFKSPKRIVRSTFRKLGVC